MAEDAPCGRQVGGHRYRDSDDQGLVLDDLVYACGCRHIHHQFHDGSGRVRLIRHDGKVLMDECSPERGE
jgi:hypothetical protein